MFWITGILGLLLGLSPFIFGFANQGIALWTNLVLGAVVVLVSLIGLTSMGADKRWMYWVIGLAGLLAIIAPFVLGYAGLASALWTSIIVGVILALWDGAKVFQQPAT